MPRGGNGGEGRAGPSVTIGATHINDFERAYREGWRVSWAGNNGVMYAFRSECDRPRLFDSMTGRELNQARPGFWRAYAPLGSQQISAAAIFWSSAAVLVAISGALL
jgi:hypothetical protein